MRVPLLLCERTLSPWRGFASHTILNPLSHNLHIRNRGAFMRICSHSGMTSVRKEETMKRKTLLVAAIAASLALGSVAALAETGVTDVFDTNTEAPAFAVQTQLRTQIQDPELMGTDDALMATVQTRLKAKVHDPLEMGVGAPEEALMATVQTRLKAKVHDPLEMGVGAPEEAPMTQERSEVRSEFHNGEATPAGELLQDRDRDQVRDSLVGGSDGNGVGDGECDGECDGPVNTQDETGAGNQYGTPGGNK